MKRFAALAGALAMLAVLRFAWTHAFSFYDDAYIYFRYADNVVHGCGLDFRCEGSPPVEGFTSPLYMALLLGVRAFTPNLEAGALVLGGVGVALTVWLAALAAYAASPRPLAWLVGLLVLAALACDDFVLLNAVTGLETALFMACTMAACWAGVTERERLLGWTLALTVLARPEGVLMLALVRRARVAVPAVAALLALSTARWLYYGDLLPNTYYAKAGGTAAHVTLGVAYIGEIVQAYPLILAAPTVLVRTSLRPIGLAFVGAALVLLTSFLRTGGDLFGYGRLFVPLLAPLYVCAALGIVQLGARWRGWSLAPVFACALFALLAHRLAPQHGFPNVLRWSTVGRWLQCAHPGARVATVPIGAIAYRSGSPVIDLVGLTSREIAHAGATVPPERLTRAWIGHERHDTDWVLRQRPALIVLGTKYGTAPIPDVRTMRAGFWAEWELLSLAQEGRIPYEAYTPEIVPGVYWHMLRAHGTPDRSDTRCQVR